MNSSTESSHNILTPENDDLPRQKQITSYMDSLFYKAAAESKIDPFNSHKESLDLLLTPNNNTILHIHISERTKTQESVTFMEQILSMCPSLLDQANIRKETPLHIAARHGHHVVVKALIDRAKSRHEDVETGAGAAREMLRMTNIDKETALHEAARHNHVGVVRILTKEDPDFIYSGNEAAESPLYLAAERGYSEIVSEILETCKSPDYRGPNGRTALHEAVIRNDAGMVTKILGKNRTLTNEKDGQGWTPLHHACHFNYLSIVKQLIEFDRSAAYIGDTDGMIPLHIAVVGGYSNDEVVKNILAYCPDCHEIVDQKGRNFLHLAVQGGSYTLLGALLGQYNCDVYLPSMANLVNQKDADGNTPLHLLATYCLDSGPLIRHPLFDKKTVNKLNLTPLDVVRSVEEHSTGFKGSTERKMKKAGYEGSYRTIIKAKDRLIKLDLSEIRKVKNEDMIVAALIATVSFAAGFTLPGGYDAEKGIGQGTAILARKTAFKTFLITDAIALVLSSSAVFIHYLGTWYDNNRRMMSNFITIVGILIPIAMVSLVAAFMAGTFVVLPHSSGIGIAICAITSCFLFLCYHPLKLVFFS